MKKPNKKLAKLGLKPSVLISLIVLALIAVSTLLVSGKFSALISPFAPLINPFASSSNPKITENYSDAFKSDKIDESKWTLHKNGDAQIKQTAADNLRFDIPAGDVNKKAKTANITFNQVFNDKDDFRVVAVLYKPLVTGDGSGVTGVRFASTGEDNDEGAVIRWVSNGANSKVSFIVTGPNGKKLESQAAVLNTNVAVFRLERINKKYRAFYKEGKDQTADVAWKQIGQEQNGKLGEDGKVRLFASNVGADGKFPKLVARYDSVAIGWQGAEKTSVSFSDAFANDAVGKSWKQNASDGVVIKENSNDNLIISVPAGSVGKNPKRGAIVRNEPVVPKNKDFTMQAEAIKPVVTGAGFGVAGISFHSAGSSNDEAAQVRWVVGKEVSRLVFVVRDANGVLTERAAVNDIKAQKVTMRLVRRGDKYSGYYRVGDSDASFVKLGSEEQDTLGADGKIGIFASNMGAESKFPAVIGRFDRANGSVSK